MIKLQIYNFMTTREAISGRLIAAVGMRDGAAMKALALLTMVFLPGTFIAVGSQPLTFFVVTELTQADNFLHAGD